MKETVEKVDAARRQLDTAITLWFRKADPISIHTLACSSYQIIHDINRHKKGRDLLYDTLIVKEEFRREAINLLKKSYNFFKHAKTDPDGKIEFDPEYTGHFIMFAIIGLEALGVKSNNLRFSFTVFFALHHSNLITDSARQYIEKSLTVEQLDDIRKLDRSQFLENFNLLLSRS